MTFWNRFYDLCLKNGIKPNTVAKELGFSNAVCTQWKQGKQKPSAERLLKLSDYFGVSVDYLLNGSPEPAVVVSDNVMNNINGDNNINVTLSDDEQILNMIKDLDLVQKSKVILAIDEIRKGN